MEEYWNPMVPELSVSDFKASLSFYVDVLGFSIRIKREAPDFVYLKDANFGTSEWQPNKKSTRQKTDGFFRWLFKR